MKINSIKEVMSTTEVGETIVLKEIEINTYLRRPYSLKRINSESVNIKRISNRHRRYRLIDFQRLRDIFLRHLKLEKK